MLCDYEKILVKDVVCKKYIILKENDQLNNAINILLKNNMKEVIITDDQNNLTGILTLTDISRVIKRNENKKLILKECMLSNLITVKEDESLLSCRDIMKKNKIGILPVLEKGRLIGVIRKQEIINFFYMALEKDDVKLNHIVDSLHEAVCVINELGRVAIWNKSAEKLYDVFASDILGQPLEDFFPDAMDMKVFRTKKAVENAYHSPKENCYIIISAAPIFIDGKFLGVMSTDWDVSEFRKLTNELQKANETVEFLKREMKKISNDGFGEVIGKNPKLLEKIELAKQVAKTKTNILITGESGTGKEVFARAIHDCSGQKGLFVPINCSAIPNELFESELFGYEQGAFTGANKKGKVGLFEMAHDGTIFLDEIGDLPMFMQAKLLRVLQDKIIRRVGSEKYININVRILSATNKDLKEMAELGTFREDLYYRLDVVQIELPPLRERGKDIVLLIDYFLEEISKQNNKESMKINQEVIQILENYNWKGNIRELKNTIEYLIVLCKGNTITIDSIPNYILKETRKKNKKEGGPLDLNKAIVEFEVEIIQRALKLANGNKAKAAKLLNIPRATLYYKVQHYNISCI